MSEYIGSRISLISKSDIKYIGTLHEINSDSHTVALESVTSYGTEGRKGNPAEEIPGSDQVYEYIVFRGSDVKELTIVAPPGAKENQAPPKMPDDPAILGSARPNQQPPPQQPPPSQAQYGGPQHPYSQPPPQFDYRGPPPPSFPNQQPRFQGPGGPHGFPGTPGAVPGYGMGFAPPPGYYGPPPGQGFPNQPPPHNFPQNHQNFPQNQHVPPGMQGPQPHQQRPQQAQPPAGSQSGTPQPTASNDARPSQATPPVTAKSGNASAATAPMTGIPPPTAPAQATLSSSTPDPASGNAAVPQKIAPKQNSRVAVPLPAARPAQRSVNPAQATAPTAPTGQPQSIADATQAATAAVAAAMAKLGPVNQNTAPTSTRVDDVTQKVNQMRVQDPQRGRGRGRGRAGGPQGVRRESGQKQVDVPKEDFDFESANAKFNKQDLVKEAIASGSPVDTPPNGTVTDGNATTNGAPNGEAESDDVVIPAKPATERGYNKQSSFFDNISSDLKDRIEQSQNDGSSIDGRTMRREERSKNVETFGQGSVDQGGYRGGFRGRGRGGRGYGYRGNRGGFENRGGGYRGRGGRGAAETTFA